MLDIDTSAPTCEISEMQPSASDVKARRKASEATAIKMLPKLVEAFQWNQKDRLAVASENLAVAIEEHYPAVAKKLRDIIRSEMRPLPRLAPPTDLLSIEDPRHGLADVIVSSKVEESIAAIVQEHHRSDELRAYGLHPRHRVLFYGAPGNGKTMLAEALAHALEVPLLRVKYGGLIASYMGETGKNIEKVFEYAKTGPCLVFLDEFDGIGIDRNSGNNELGEIRRVTNHLLIALERLPPTCVFVAATNSIGLVDSALKRRFDFVIELSTPDVSLRLRCAQKELAAVLTPGRDVSHLANRVSEMSLASPNLFEVVELCRRIRRDLVLNDGAGVDAMLAQ